jgi:hypothetical protein
MAISQSLSYLSQYVFIDKLLYSGDKVLLNKGGKHAKPDIVIPLGHCCPERSLCRE